MSDGTQHIWADFLSFIDSQIALPKEHPHACPYLPDRLASNFAFLAEQLDPDLYQLLMDRGFRRSGRLFYKPVCFLCSQCRPIRVPVAAFRFSRSQRRTWRRNADVSVTVDKPALTDERITLYIRYLSHQHDAGMAEDEADLKRFLYESPVNTLEFSYRLGDRLVGVGIADLSTKSLSSVYFMFEPCEARRSLGVFSALWEIQWCRERNVPYYYLGFYVRDCRRMNYKARFRPCEELGDDGLWRPLDSPSEPTLTEHCARHVPQPANHDPGGIET